MCGRGGVPGAGLLRDRVCGDLHHPPSTPDPTHPEVTRNTPINAGQAPYVLEAAVHALGTWSRTGVAPAPAPRLEIGTSGSTPALVLDADADGNVKGGIRTSSVDAPVATLSGLGQEGSLNCTLFGPPTPTPPSGPRAAPQRVADTG
ncbi:alpha/beta hydrolase domain-containing protein [Streptomyces fuscichromogenes]|uniref:Alpha/beta hydrolase domain-containing protein n=1 Tax=Streptomyces fuscichromogenes TaxID=1324013 RepID=A0A917XJX4_9ACTN|nr:alpha/beta hydrolase domain-containing protein [Streptomyces fuscichromogenes]GGN34098.1 hypothetical protein GCM10011578_074580 [Streptomyces fuscichromogenes]